MEQYIYLGQQDSTLFFLHTIYNQDLFKDGISDQIYNCLVNDKFIESPDNNVIIYEINPSTYTTDAICIQHSTKKEIVNFDEESLQDQLQRLVGLDRNYEIYIIAYDYEKNEYYSYLKDLFISGSQIDKVIIENIEYIMAIESF